jgi:hypothetical protein
MTIAEDNRLRFVANFNAAIGDKHGRPLTYVNDKQLARIISEKDRQKFSLQLGKKLKETSAKTAKAPKAAKVVPGPTSAADIQKLLKGESGGTQKLSGGITLGGSPSAQGPEEQPGDKSLLKALWHKIDTSTDNVTDIAKIPLRLGGDAVMRVSDVMSRPDYALAEAMRRGVEAINSGSNVWDIADDVGEGALGGVTGKKKTGWGNVAEEQLDPDNNRTGLSELLFGRTGNTQVINGPDGKPKIIEQGDPEWDKDVYKWDNRIKGLAGDIFLSPTSHGGAKAGTTVGRELAEAGGRSLGKGIAKGAIVTGKDAFRAEARNAIKKVMGEKGIADTPRLRSGSTVTKNLSDHLADVADEQIDKMTHELRNGKLIGAGKNEMDVVARTIAEAHRADIVSRVQSSARRYSEQLANGKKYLPSELKRIRERNPTFGKWLDTADEIIKEGEVTADELFDATNQRFLTKLDPDIRDIYTATKSKLDDALMKVPTVEFMGKKMYIPSLNKLTPHIKRLPGAEEVSVAVNKALRYSSHFPGDTSHIVQKRRVSEMEQLDAYGKELESLFEGTTAEQRKAIHLAIEEGTELTGVEGMIQKEVKRRYKEMYDDEVGRGVRSRAETPEAENYVFNYLNSLGRTHGKLDEVWRNPKKLQVKHTGGVGEFNSITAKARHWNPEIDAGRALLKRKAKSIRKMSKVDFKTDLATQYGIRSFITPKAAHAAGMKELDAKDFAHLYKDLKPGERLYLDKNLHGVYENYLGLMDSSLSRNIFLKSLVSTTKAFKLLNTISFPAYHVKNFLSDIMLSSMDGVTPNKYGQVVNAFIHKNSAKLTVGGERIPFSRVHRSYLDNAAGGYLNTELNYGKTGHILEQTPRQIARAGANVVSKIGEKRENFGRLTHYWHALDEEMTFQLKKGVPREQAWKNAEKSATERVNKYLFDYNALTPTERNIRAYGVPFYTFARKAAPMLTEAMLMHPKHFVMPFKLQKALAPSDEYQNDKLPSWAKELGYSEVDPDRHIGFTNQLTPGGMLQNMFSKPAAQLNPLGQLPFELNSGKDTYSGKPVNNIGDYLKNKMRGVSTYRSIESDTKPTLEKWANLFGIPLTQITPVREGQRLSELEQEVTDRSTKLNKGLDDLGLKVRVSKGKVYLVQPKSPTSFEISHNLPPRYPKRDKEVIRGTYDSFVEIEKLLK